MTGEKEGDMRGIIPRSVEQIIEQIMLMRINGWEIVVTTSMVRYWVRSDLGLTSGICITRYYTPQIALKCFQNLMITI